LAELTGCGLAEGRGIVNKCPVCAESGMRSRVFVPGGSVVTLMATQDYYDEDGRFHHHDPNSRTRQFTCSEGHAWVEVSTIGCEPCGRESTLTVRRVQSGEGPGIRREGDR
jgi:hypothetical protein